MTAALELPATPDAEAVVWSAISDLPGVTSFSYTATPLDRLGWVTAVYVQVDARSKRRTPARDRAEEARRRILALPAAEWAGGVVCLVNVIEAPFFLPDDDGLPRYAARYEIRVHPRRAEPGHNPRRNPA